MATAEGTASELTTWKREQKKMRGAEGGYTADATDHARPWGKAAYFGEHDVALDIDGLWLLVLVCLFAHARGKEEEGRERGCATDKRMVEEHTKVLLGYFHM